MNIQKDIYFHLGLTSKGSNIWKWEKVKMSDSELGEIVYNLKKDESKFSFFHKFDNSKTQIWCNKSLRGFSIKINDFSKNISLGEAEVLRILIEECIRRRNFN